MTLSRQPITQTFPRLHMVSLVLDHLHEMLGGLELSEQTTDAELSEAVEVLRLQLAQVGELLAHLERMDATDPSLKPLLDLVFVARMTLPGHQLAIGCLDRSDRWGCMLSVSRIVEETLGLVHAMRGCLSHAQDAPEQVWETQHRAALQRRAAIAAVYRIAIRGGEPPAELATLRLRLIESGLRRLLHDSSHGLRLEDLHTLRGLHAKLAQAEEETLDGKTALQLWEDSQTALQLLLAMHHRNTTPQNDEALVRRLLDELEHTTDRADVEPLLRDLLPLFGRGSALDALLVSNVLPTVAELRESLAELVPPAPSGNVLPLLPNATPRAASRGADEQLPMALSRGA